MPSAIVDILQQHKQFIHPFARLTFFFILCVYIFRLEQALGTKKTNQEKSRDEFGRSATVSKESSLVAVCLNKMSLRLLTEDLDIAEFIVKSKILILLVPTKKVQVTN